MTNKSKDINKIVHTPIGRIGVFIIWLFLCITSGWVTDCADIDNYRAYYESSSRTDYYVRTFSNPGFYFLYTIFQSLGFSFKDYHILFYVCIMTFLVWFVWRYSRKPVVVLLLYIAVAFFGDVIQMKNSLAIVFLYIALIGIIDKKWEHMKLITAVILLLSATIHVGFLSYMVLLLYDRKINSKIYISSMIILSLVGHSILQSFTQYALLLEADSIVGKAEDYLSGGSIFSVFACSIVYLINIFTCKRFFKWNYDTTIYVDRLLTINVLLSVIIIFSSVNMTFFRLFRNMILFNSVFIINGYVKSKKTPADLTVILFYFFVMSYFYLLRGHIAEDVVNILQSNSLL